MKTNCWNFDMNYKQLAINGVFVNRLNPCEVQLKGQMNVAYMNECPIFSFSVQ